MNEVISLLLSALTEAVFVQVIVSAEKRAIAGKIKKLLSGDPAHLAFQRCLAVAYKALSRNYPQWVTSLFDEHFLLHNSDVTQELSKILSRDGEVSAERLVMLWEKQFVSPPSGLRESPFQATRYLLSILTLECKAQEVLQPFFDRRAFEKLHDIARFNEDQVHLLADIKSLIREGNKYRNRSGGIIPQALYRANSVFRE